MQQGNPSRQPVDRFNQPYPLMMQFRQENAIHMVGGGFCVRPGLASLQSSSLEKGPLLPPSDIEVLREAKHHSHYPHSNQPALQSSF